MVKKEDEFNEFKGDGIKTTITHLKDVIKEKMEQLKDLATLELMLDVNVRMRKRLESIRKMSSAESLKINGHWKTISPEIHISGLMGRKIDNNECEIRFSVYETDNKGNKKLFVHHAEVVLHDGSKIQRETSAEYRVAYEVVERILRNKPIVREIIRVSPEVKEE